MAYLMVCLALCEAVFKRASEVVTQTAAGAPIFRGGCVASRTNHGERERRITKCKRTRRQGWGKQWCRSAFGVVLEAEMTSAVRQRKIYYCFGVYVLISLVSPPKKDKTRSRIDISSEVRWCLFLSIIWVSNSGLFTNRKKNGDWK